MRKRLAHVAQRAYVEVAGFTQVSHMLVNLPKLIGRPIQNDTPLTKLRQK